MPASTVQIVIQAVNQATGPINQVNQSLQGMNQHAQGASRELHKMGGQLDKVASLAEGVLIGMLAFKVLEGIGAVFDGIGAAVISFNATLEQSRIGWTTMLGSAEVADEMLRQMAVFAAETPFEFPELDAAARRLLAMGFSAKQVLPTLRTVGNAAAALGSGKEGIDRITYAIGQMLTRTKVSANEMRQLTEAGIPAWDILAQAIDKPIGEVMKLTEQGKIASTTFIDAFNKFVELNWGDMMEKQSKTFLGALSTIKDNVLLVSSDAFKPLFDSISQTLVAFAEFTKTAEFKRWGKEVKGIVKDVMRDIDALGNQLADFGFALMTTVKWIGEGFKREWGDIYKEVAVRSGTIDMRPFAGLKELREDAIAIAKALGFFKVELPDKAMPQFTESLEDASDKLARLREQMRNVIASSSELINYLISIDPAAVAAAAAVDTLRLRLVGLKDQQAGLQESIRASQDVLRGLQDQVSGLESALSAAKQKLTDLASPQLEGMGALDEQIFQIQQQIKRLKLEEMGLDSSAFKPMTEEAKKFAATLPSSIEELEDMLEALGLQKSLKFDELLRKIAEEAKGAAKELTFEEAIKQIRDTKAEIGNLEGNLAGARAAAEAQAAAIETMRRAADDMTKAIQQMQKDLQIQEDRQKLVNDALKIAYDWFVNDREKLMDMGSEAVTQAGIIDTATRDLLSLTSQYAQGEASAAVTAIEAALNAYRLARAEMAGGLGGGSAAAAQYRAWQEGRRAAGENADDWEAFRQHMIGIGAGDPGAVKGFAGGTRYFGGGLAMVGELGPKLVSLPRGSRIYPSSETGRMAGNTYNFSLVLNNPTDKSEIMQNFLTLKALAGA